MRVVLESLNQLRTKLEDSLHILALDDHLLHWIPVDRTHNLLRVVALLLEIVNENLCQFHAVTLAGREIYLDDVAIDAVEQLLNKLLADILSCDAERERVDALVENVECLSVGSLGIVGSDFLTDVPCVVVLLVATNKRELAWQSVRSVKFIDILLTVERLHVEALWRTPYQAFLKISTLQVNLDLVEPFLSGRCLKLGEEFLLGVTHNFLYFPLIK